MRKRSANVAAVTWGFLCESVATATTKADETARHSLRGKRVAWNGKHPHLPEQLSSLPELFSMLPEQFSSLPELFSTLPEQFSSLPELFSTLPEQFFLLSEQFSRRP
ncbi:hypothetical protein ACIQ57_01290 [Lysinibacillus xylanilyticus]|uniref:hypothetical protein n=1 Tax=Lysinibacillus xylanilyticus TaxID=582475 RepID=UPI00381EB767